MILDHPIYSKTRTYIKSYYLEFLEERGLIGAMLDSSVEYWLNNYFSGYYKLSATSIVDNDFLIKVPWFPIIIDIDDLDYYLYNDPLEPEYAENTSVFYGSKKPSLYAILPEDFVDTDLITDSILSPSISFTKNQDFVVETAGEKKLIRFSERVLDIEDIKIVDGKRLVILWAKFSSFLNEYFFETSKLFTEYLVHKNEYGLQFIDTLYKIRTSGFTLEMFYKLIEGMLETPIAYNDEKIAYINDAVILTETRTFDARGKLHNFNVDDIIPAGRSIFGGVNIYFGEDIVNAGSLELTRVPGSNAIFNIEVTDTSGIPQVIGVDNEGNTILSLPSSGAGAFQFWTLLHKNSIKGGKTLAESLYGSPQVQQTFLNSRPVNTLDLLSKTVMYNDILIELDSNTVDLNYFNSLKSVFGKIKNTSSDILIKVV